MEPTSPTSEQPLPTLSPERPKKGKGMRLLVVVVVVVLLGALAGYFLMNRGSSASESDTAQVVITAARFTPSTIKIKKGQSVAWVNQDGQAHQIASDPYPSEDLLPALNSQEPLARGESYTFTFDKAGTYTYHDHLNPLALRGTVIVE